MRTGKASLGAWAIVSIGLASGALAQAISPVVDQATGQPVLYPSYVTEFDGQLYFRGNLPGEGAILSLWRSDGSMAQRVVNGAEASYLQPYNGKLFYSAGNKLWQYDPATGASLAPGGSSQAGLPQDLTSYNGNLYFRAFRSNVGVELWKFDGANQTLIEMYPGTGSSYPQHFIEYNGLLYFNANGTPGQGTELWRYNSSGMPTEAARIYPNNGSSPEQFAVYNGKLYFSAYDGVHGRELWSYDGAQAKLMTDIVPGGQYSSSNPNNLVAFQDKLYFSATDGVHGYELWSFDGTAASMVAEINPTPNPGNGDDFLMDSSPAGFTIFNGLLYFSADDGAHGRELWSFDGTTARLARDINFGPYGSDPSEMTVYNGRLFFSADDGYVPGLSALRPRVFALAMPEPGMVGMIAIAGVWMLRRRA